jgi:outer membrane protein OmpA-like peptidoglycan-associated protein
MPLHAPTMPRPPAGYGTGHGTGYGPAYRPAPAYAPPVYAPRGYAPPGYAPWGGPPRGGWGYGRNDTTGSLYGDTSGNLVGDGSADAAGAGDFSMAMSGSGRSNLRGYGQGSGYGDGWGRGYGYNRPYVGPGYGYPVAPPAMAAAPAAEPVVEAESPVAPADGDADGVADLVDLCPGTEAGATVDVLGCPEQARIVLSGVNFKTDSDELTAESLAILDGVSATLAANPDVRVMVAGHTDADGEAAYNKDLSQRRAQQVVAYLVEHGVQPDNLTAQGFGEEQPVADNDTPEGKAQNRRVELNRL